MCSPIFVCKTQLKFNLASVQMRGIHIMKKKKSWHCQAAYVGFSNKLNKNLLLKCAKLLLSSSSSSSNYIELSLIINKVEKLQNPCGSRSRWDNNWGTFLLQVQKFLFIVENLIIKLVYVRGMSTTPLSTSSFPRLHSHSLTPTLVTSQVKKRKTKK